MADAAKFKCRQQKQSSGLRNRAFAHAFVGPHLDRRGRVLVSELSGDMLSDAFYCGLRVQKITAAAGDQQFEFALSGAILESVTVNALVLDLVRKVRC